MKLKNILALLVTLLLALAIILTLENNVLFPAFGDADLSGGVSGQYLDPAWIEEIGAANLVTAIVVGFRGFDTLGEVTVLFISSLGVALLFGTGRKQKRLEADFSPNFMLRVGSRLLFGVILLVGLYIILHGHLTPAALSRRHDDRQRDPPSVSRGRPLRARIKGFKILESASGSLFVVIGLLGLVLATYFLQNFLPAGTVGDLLSAGIFPILYILIGLKVGSEISGIIDNFLTEEEAK